MQSCSCYRRMQAQRATLPFGRWRLFLICLLLADPAWKARRGAAALGCLEAAQPAAAVPQAKPQPGRPRIRLDLGHPWRPPFGLERVGRPLAVVVEFPADGPWLSDLSLVGYLEGKEIARHVLKPSGKPPSTRVTFDVWPTEVVLLGRSGGQPPVELARLVVQVPAMEADGLARPDAVIHPVDLGTILVPSDWLLLAGAQRGSMDVAAVCRSGDVPRARVTAYFESGPQAPTAAEMPLARNRRAQVRLALPPTPASAERDVLHVSIGPASGQELWHKKIPTMIVRRRPQWPAFGATQTSLRYDAPISIRGSDGKLSSMRYEDAWDPQLRDVVVSLPNGARFVFWRGSSYVPFWAGRWNTGLSYEWAETSPPKDGFEDCVEPLMDKELRYGRVRIVETSPVRVHVRWSYQSCDFKYKVWGDSAVEDFYFYPDGFGTRVLSLLSEPGGDYELSEFIVLTPQATYPFSVLPPNLVDILFVDGQRRELRFPFFPAEQGEKMKPRGIPAVYRVRLHKDEPLAGVYFNPLDTQLPPAVFHPFSDQGVVVTPTYWGSHWPLARGKTTGWSIDDRIHLTPCHNSVMSWARSRPAPLRTARLVTLDTLGRSKPMLLQTWVWLIGMSEAGDERLLAWARSFAEPPSLAVQGARLEAETYVPERRAMRLHVEAKSVAIAVKPAAPCVHPVFELDAAPPRLERVELGGRALESRQYAWDGHTLWLDATISQPTVLRLEFAEPPK